MVQWLGLAAILTLLMGVRPPISVAQQMSPEFHGCMTDTQGVQMGVRNGFPALEFQRREEEMNSVITRMRNSPDFDNLPDDKKTSESLLKHSVSVLVHAQRKWQLCRDAECKWNAARAGAGSLRGSMNALTYRSCQIKMTIDRIKLLKSQA